MQKTVVIIAAAGSGNRFGGELPKQYQKLSDGSMILAKVIEKFISHPEIDFVITSIDQAHQSLYQEVAQALPDPKGKLLPPVYGGRDRHLSVLNGLKVFSEHKPGIVLIQDGCRPFLSSNLISNIIAATRKHDAAIPLVPSFETLKEVKDGFVSNTMERSKIFRAQTPQGFKFDKLFELAQKNKDALTDDSQLFERAGLKVAAVEGESSNIKITFKEDIL